MPVVQNGSRNDRCQGKIPTTICFNDIEDIFPRPERRYVVHLR
jgi:hypothetical protein